MRRLMLWILLAVGGCSAGRHGSTRAVEVASLHFDPNALITAEPEGDAIIALTKSGDLLRLDAQLRLVGVRSDVVYTCLGHDDHGRLIAGRQDDVIDRIDPVTLARKELWRDIGFVHSPVEWVGGDPRTHRLLALVEREDSSRQLKVIGDLTTDHSLLLPWQVNVLPGEIACFIDNRSRCWIASNHGEFGAEMAVIDIATDRVYDLGRSENLNGFIEPRRGVLLAFGGSENGECYTNVYRVAPDNTLHSLYALGPLEGPRAGHPFGAVTAMVPFDPSEGFAVFTRGDVIEFNGDFTRSKVLANQTILPEGEPWRPLTVTRAFNFQHRLLAVTEDSGLVEYVGGRRVSRVIAVSAQASGTRTR